MIADGNTRKARAAAARRPEQFGVLVVIRSHEFALRRHDIDSLDTMAGMAPKTRIPSDASAEQIATDFDCRTMSGRKAKSVRFQMDDNLAIADERLNACPH